MSKLVRNTAWLLAKTAQFTILELVYKVLAKPWRFYPPSVKEKTMGWRLSITNKLTSIKDEVKELVI